MPTAKSVLDLPQAVCVLSLVLVCLVPVFISLHVNVNEKEKKFSTITQEGRSVWSRFLVLLTPTESGEQESAHKYISTI
jgi:hypothetical protein